MSELTPTPDVASRGGRFISNVLWAWAGVGVPILTGIVLSPFIIRKLGPEGYGLWSLAFSTIGYYNLLDLGFRSAVVRFTAHYHARQEYEKINELINTTLAYLSAASLVLLVITVLFSRTADRFFNISPAYRDDFRWLVLLIGVSISLGVTWNVFTGCVEGFQRFDISSRISIITMTLRSVGVAVLLALGYGLVAMGTWALLTQLLTLLMYTVNLRRFYRPLRFSSSLIKFSVLKEIAAYGLHTFVASLATVSLTEGPSVVIGHLRPAADVGFYNLPSRLLSYVTDMIGRVGLVVAPRAAELAATGQLDLVSRLAGNVNRYCVTLFMPLGIVLFTCGHQVIQLWVGPEFATHSAPLLPFLVVGVGLSLGAQYTSGSVLFGLGKHQVYAWTLLVEAFCCLTFMAAVVSTKGLVAAAVVASSLMVLNRGLITPWLVCRALNHSYAAYMQSILAAPLLTALPVFVLTYGLKMWLAPTQGWLQLIAVVLTAGAVYYTAAFFTCLEAEHKRALLNWLSSRLRR